MLVDGMDVSIALVNDEETGITKVVPNKGRDMAPLNDLRLKFVGAGEKDPDTREFLSGVVAPLTEEDKDAILAEKFRLGTRPAKHLAQAGRAGSGQLLLVSVFFFALLPGFWFVMGSPSGSVRG
jgi:hypothetical protein